MKCDFFIVAPELLSACSWHFCITGESIGPVREGRTAGCDIGCLDGVAQAIRSVLQMEMVQVKAQVLGKQTQVCNDKVTGGT